MPPLIAIVLAAVFGLLFGSFANVLITRLPLRENIAVPASHCRKCGAAVRPWHNIPVVSWVVLRGRCATCGETIGWRYPVVEGVTCALFVLCVAHFGWSPAAVAGCAFCLLCLVLLFADLESFLLPDVLTLPGIPLGVLLSGWAASPARRVLVVEHHVLAALLGALLILAIRYAYRAARGQHGMGLGDAKLLAMIGAFLGVGGVLVTFAFGTLGAALAGGMAVAKSRANFKTALPFGAFLCAAAVAALFIGPQIVHWYLSYLR